MLNLSIINISHLLDKEQRQVNGCIIELHYLKLYFTIYPLLKVAHVNLLLKCKKQKKFKCLLYCLLWWFSAQFMWELDTCPSLTITHDAVILSGDIMKDPPQTHTHPQTYWEGSTNRAASRVSKSLPNTTLALASTNGKSTNLKKWCHTINQSFWVSTLPSLGYKVVNKKLILNINLAFQYLEDTIYPKCLTWSTTSPRVRWFLNFFDYTKTIQWKSPFFYFTASPALFIPSHFYFSP